MSAPGYVLPDKPASYFSDQALEILKHIEKAMPAMLPCMLRSDIVLTISGARALTTYIESSELPETQRQKLIDYLSSRNIALFEEILPGYPNEINTNWYILHEAEFQAVPIRYPNFIKYQMPKKRIKNFTELIVWTYMHEGLIRNFFVDRSFPLADDEFMKAQFAAHDVRFGILLGYPMKAILGDITVSEKRKTHAATIAYADAHDSAQPTYTIDDALIDDPQIKIHQKLWSDILSLVYESEWYKSLN